MQKMQFISSILKGSEIFILDLNELDSIVSEAEPGSWSHLIPKSATGYKKPYWICGYPLTDFDIKL